jgi:hypothetical protein
MPPPPGRRLRPPSSRTWSRCGRQSWRCVGGSARRWWGRLPALRCPLPVPCCPPPPPSPLCRPVAPRPYPPVSIVLCLGRGATRRRALLHPTRVARGYLRQSLRPPRLSLRCAPCSSSRQGCFRTSTVLPVPPSPGGGPHARLRRAPGSPARRVPAVARAVRGAGAGGRPPADRTRRRARGPAVRAAGVGRPGPRFHCLGCVPPRAAFFLRDPPPPPLGTAPRLGTVVATTLLCRNKNRRWLCRVHVACGMYPVPCALRPSCIHPVPVCRHGDERPAAGYVVRGVAAGHPAAATTARAAGAGRAPESRVCPWFWRCCCAGRAGPHWSPRSSRPRTS